MQVFLTVVVDLSPISHNFERLACYQQSKNNLYQLASTL